MNSVSFEELAFSFRHQVLKTWLFRSGLPQSKAAMQLGVSAFDYGFLNEPKVLSGSILATWGKSKSTPYWAAATALSMLLKDNWVPSSYSGWAGTASLLVRCNQSSDLDEYINLFPAHIDRFLVAGWFLAALTTREFFVYEKNHRIN